MLITEQEIVYVIEKTYPTAKWWSNFWVGYKVTGDGSKQEVDAEIVSWEVLNTPQPTKKQLRKMIQDLRQNGGIPKSPPQSIKASKGGMAIIELGHMDKILEIVNDPKTPVSVKWAFERTDEWDYDSSFLSYLFEKAQITKEQKDEIFFLASNIKV